MYLKLCYLESSVMYFTSDIDNQWGDDWDDIPYEHNAGKPYETNTIVKKIAFIRKRRKTPVFRHGDIRRVHLICVSN